MRVRGVQGRGGGRGVGRGSHPKVETVITLG